jgi:hypothetical protein
MTVSIRRLIITASPAAVARYGTIADAPEIRGSGGAEIPLLSKI